MLSAAQGFIYNKFEKPNDWPKIDKTFDYKIENGKLLSGNEHIYLSGPVTYTKIGNPTIVDGIVSGFSTSNYAQMTSSINIEQWKDFEFNIKFKTGTQVTQTNSLFTVGYDGIGYGAGININSNKVILWQLFNIGGEKSLGSVDLDSAYVLSIKRTNGEYIVSNLYKEGVLVYTTSWTSNAGESTNDLVRIGRSYTADNSYFQGTIDLNETYIKVNGKIWFYGKNYTTKNMVPVPAGLEYNNTTTPSIGWVDTDTSSSNFQQFTQAPEGTMIGKDDTHSLAVETYQDKGIVDYTVVGSPTIVDGVASGFSSSDYLTLPAISVSNNTPFEINIKYKIGTIPSSGNTDIFTINGENITYLLRLLFSNEYKNSSCMIYDTTSETNKYINITGSPYQDNTVYTTKMQYDGSILTNSLYDSDGVLLGTNSASCDVNISGYISILAKTDVISEIDLNQTYIKVNGQYWFHPYPNSYPKLVGPVNYTVVGSPTIVNGIVSGFSYNDYVYTSSGFSSSYTNYEMVIRAKPDANSYALLTQSSGVGTDLKLFFSDRFFSIIPAGGTAGRFDMWGSFDTNTFYYLKYIRSGNNITLAYSTDGITWAGQVTAVVSAWNTSNNTLNFGINRNYGDTLKGEIDLNNTYIKVNGAIWFGKEDWTPSTYTDNAIYLLGSHSTDYSTYNTQGINPTIETDSDESGTYNVWIDNQEIYKEQSNPLDINWSNLALTTGYDITTPSTLKAHVIKVEPNNGNITGFSTDTNYKVENGLLTWASPKLYLEGPVDYTIVGNPTIEDGVASGFSTSSYLQISQTYNATNNKNVEIYVRAKTPTTITSSFNPIFGADTIGDWGISSYTNALFTIRMGYANGTSFTFGDMYISGGIQADTWYRFKIKGNNGIWRAEIYNDSGALLNSSDKDWTSNTFSVNYTINLKCTDNTNTYSGSIDLNNTYIKVNGQLWFGKIYTSETYVPVPTNFTYGNTTTSSNGTVNLTTQEFSADTLATYGKDN